MKNALRITATVDHEAHAVYFKHSDSEIFRTVEYASGVYLDLDREGNLIGVEMIKSGTIRINLKKIAREYGVKDLAKLPIEQYEKVLASA